jgi:hypothetical protein
VTDVTDLRVQVDELIGLLTQLRAEIGQPARRDQENHVKTKIPASPAPWNDLVANLVYDVEAGARDHESKLLWIAFSQQRHRPPTVAGSTRSLRELPDLIAHVERQFPERKAPRHAEADLRTWGRECRLLLDQARAGDERPCQAPGGLVCPVCERPLWLPAGWDTVQVSKVRAYCLTCRDENGRRLDWAADAWIGALNGGAA